jgi:hypothetical protein
MLSPAVFFCWLLVLMLSMRGRFWVLVWLPVELVIRCRFGDLFTVKTLLSVVPGPAWSIGSTDAFREFEIVTGVVGLLSFNSHFLLSWL